MTTDRLVLIVAYEGVQLLDVAGPAEVFSTAAKLNGGGYRLQIASPDGNAVRTDSGLTLGADIALADATRPRTSTPWSSPVGLARSPPSNRPNCSPRWHRCGTARDGCARCAPGRCCSRRPGGQSQFSARLDHPVPADTTLRPVLDAIIADPSADHRLPSLAARAAVSERHLTRLFLQHTGTTPGRFVERVRVEAARGLLEQDALGVRAVAARTGFGSEETLRRAFVRALGVAPSEHLARFRSTQPEFEEVS